MFVRKKTKLRIAYGILTVTSLSVLAYDANVRSDLRFQNTEALRAQFREPVPLPITPIAQSPFPEARPSISAPNQPLLANGGSAKIPKPAKHAAASGVHFLTVAVQVDSGNGPIALHRGTRVHILRQQDGKFLVRHNRTDFLIEKSQVTDDLNTPGTLARNSS
jgi:hypothetical protein